MEPLPEIRITGRERDAANAQRQSADGGDASTDTESAAALKAKVELRQTIVFGLTAVTLLVLLISLFCITPATARRSIQATPAGMTLPSTNSEVFSLCRQYHFYTHPSGLIPHRKIYDLFLMSPELDWLEIRLNTLSPHVDYFVIVESNQTFAGLPKPLYLEENWSRFSEFSKKIIYRVVQDPGVSLGTSESAHHDFLRSSLLHSVFPTLLFTEKEAREGDILLVSDVDEIPKPATLTVLRNCDVPDRITLRSRLYHYSFQWLHAGEQWAHPQATVFHGLPTTISPADLRSGVVGQQARFTGWLSFLRRGHHNMDLWHAAWHCSWCFATMAEMRSQVDNSSHTPPNNETVMERVRTGQDLFGREGKLNTRVENNQDVPQFVLENRERFDYMLNRDGDHAGFRA